MHALQSCDKMCKGNGYSLGTCLPNISQHDTCINMNSLRIVLSCVNGSSFCINFEMQFLHHLIQLLLDTKYSNKKSSHLLILLNSFHYLVVEKYAKHGLQHVWDNGTNPIVLTKKLSFVPNIQWTTYWQLLTYLQPLA